MRLPPAEPSTSALPAMVEDPLHPHIIPLHASCATHGWGSHGDSLAARLHSLNRNTSLNLDQPYSEFVIASIDPYQATLANAPSVTLSSHIQQQVIEVDPAILEFYASLHEHGVPYVLKVLSVCSPQPLRVHPNQKNAKRLAESFNFKFPFARPVLLVAISRAEALFGFQSCEDIVSELSRVPEFADCIGRPVTDHYVHIVKTAIPNPSHIRELITSLLSRGPEVITDCLVRASKRLLKMPKDSVTENDRDLIAMQTKFPNDPMCFAVYFLNRVVLEPGSAVFIHTQELYSVLRGDLLEATTLSDAVVYGGLVEKNVQTSAFLDSLSFDDSPVEISQGERFSEHALSFIPPVPYFQLLDFKLTAGVTQHIIDTLAPSLLLVLEGDGLISITDKNTCWPLRAGSVLYLCPQMSFVVKAFKDAKSTLHFVQIGVNESAAPSTSSSCSIM